MATNGKNRRSLADDGDDLPEEVEMIDEPIGDKPPGRVIFKDAPGLDGRPSNFDAKKRPRLDKPSGRNRHRQA